MTTILSTERLVLREATPEDLDSFAALDGDAEVMRHIGPTKTAEEVADDLARVLEYYETNPGMGIFVAERSEDGLFIGWFALKELEDGPDIELGYRLLPQHWGEGYGTEGAQALLEYGFGTLSLSRVVAISAPENAASLNITTKLGMNHVGEANHYGSDVLLFEVRQDPKPDVVIPALVAFGRVLGRGAKTVGRGVVTAYNFIDPDLRRHAAHLPAAGLSLLVSKAEPVDALECDGHRPVVFVHGLGGNPGNFFALRAYFAKQGRTRTYVAHFGDADTLEEMAARLAEIVDLVVERNELEAADQIDLVAHSMGGLVARLAMEDETIRDRVHHLVTMGTPHRGSELAHYAASKAVLALRPDSELVTRLRGQSFWDEQDAPGITSIWSASDRVVLPPESARFDRGVQIEMERATHYSYLLSPSSFRTTYGCLRY